MQIRTHVPNIITAANAGFGLLALLAVFQNRHEWVLIFFLLGLFSDFLDGMIARRLGVSSALGVQLDSLADMVTSGVLPGLLVYQLMRTQSPVYWDLSINMLGWDTVFSLSHIGWVGLLLPLGVGFRLGRFNIDTEQTKYFKGLASPANALFFIGYPFLVKGTYLESLRAFLLSPEVMTLWVVFFVFLMNSPLRMFKVSFTTPLDKIYCILLFLGSLLLFVFFGAAGFSLCILYYILLCLVRNVPFV